MEMMVVEPMVTVEVGVDVVASGAGEGKKQKWWR
jgi:hypothetical protein